MPSKKVADLCFSIGVLYIIVFPFIIFTVWGTYENRHIIDFVKLKNYLVDKNCTLIPHYISNLFNYDPTTQYKDCEDFRGQLSYDMWYCYKVLLNDNSTVYLDHCLDLNNVTDIFTIHHTPFSEEFKNNPFEIALTIIVIIYFIMCICAIHMAYCTPVKRAGYTSI